MTARPDPPASRFPVKVVPGARRNAVEPDGAGGFRVWTTAVAEDGRANAAVLGLLAEHLGIPRGRLRIARGASSRHKLVQVAD